MEPRAVVVEVRGPVCSLVHWRCSRWEKHMPARKLLSLAFGSLAPTLAVVGGVVAACGGSGSPALAPSAPAAAPVAAPAPNAPAGESAAAIGRTIPHELAGREACLGCHAEGTPTGVPADHKGRDNSSCTGCHHPK